MVNRNEKGKVKKLYPKFRILQKGLKRVYKQLKQIFGKLAKKSVAMKELSNLRKIDFLLLIRKNYLPS